MTLLPEGGPAGPYLLAYLREPVYKPPEPGAERLDTPRVYGAARIPLEEQKPLRDLQAGDPVVLDLMRAPYDGIPGVNAARAHPGCRLCVHAPDGGRNSFDNTLSPHGGGLGLVFQFAEQQQARAGGQGWRDEQPAPPDGGAQRVWRWLCRWLVKHHQSGLLLGADFWCHVTHLETTVGQNDRQSISVWFTSAASNENVLALAGQLLDAVERYGLGGGGGDGSLARDVEHLSMRCERYNTFVTPAQVRDKCPWVAPDSCREDREKAANAGLERLVREKVEQTVAARAHATQAAFQDMRRHRIRLAFERAGMPPPHDRASPADRALRCLLRLRKNRVEAQRARLAEKAARLAEVAAGLAAAVARVTAAVRAEEAARAAAEGAARAAAAEEAARAAEGADEDKDKPSSFPEGYDEDIPFAVFPLAEVVPILPYLRGRDPLVVHPDGQVYVNQEDVDDVGELPPGCKFYAVPAEAVPLDPAGAEPLGPAPAEPPAPPSAEAWRELILSRVAGIHPRVEALFRQAPSPLCRHCLALEFLVTGQLEGNGKYQVLGLLCGPCRTVVGGLDLFPCPGPKGKGCGKPRFVRGIGQAAELCSACYQRQLSAGGGGARAGRAGGKGRLRR
jgi:hypothetical protein